MTHGIGSPVAPSDKKIALGVKGDVVGLAPPAVFPQPPATSLPLKDLSTAQAKAAADKCYRRSFFFIIADMEFRAVSIYFPAPEVRKTRIDN